MEVDIIVLIILGVMCAVGVGFMTVLHIRNVAIVENNNTPEEFTVLAPVGYVLFCFLGFLVTMALLITFTVTEIASVWVRVLFGFFALCFGIGVYFTSKFSLECNDESITKRWIFGSKEYKKSELTQKRTINFGFCKILYTDKRRAFSYNQSCIGAEYLDFQLKDVTEKDE